MGLLWIFLTYGIVMMKGSYRATFLTQYTCRAHSHVLTFTRLHQWLPEVLTSLNSRGCENLCFLTRAGIDTKLARRTWKSWPHLLKSAILMSCLFCQVTHPLSVGGSSRGEYAFNQHSWLWSELVSNEVESGTGVCFGVGENDCPSSKATLSIQRFRQ